MIPTGQCYRNPTFWFVAAIWAASLLLMYLATTKDFEVFSKFHYSTTLRTKANQSQPIDYLLNASTTKVEQNHPINPLMMNISMSPNTKELPESAVVAEKGKNASQLNATMNISFTLTSEIRKQLASITSIRSTQEPTTMSFHTTTKQFSTQETTTTKQPGTDSTLSNTSMELFCSNRTILDGLCQPQPSGVRRCVMTIYATGRLGNAMGQYATLYVLARWNRHPAFMMPDMADVLRRYFQVSMPSLERETAICLEKSMTRQWVTDWMQETYKSFDVPADQPLMLTGYPCSWTFYNHIREEIVREFTLHTHIVARAQETLHSLVADNETSPATFVGIHARRTDYVDLMAGEYKGVVADVSFFTRAMSYFRSRYSDAVFVVASDDMEWCRQNIDNSLGDVHFVGGGNVDDPIGDFALLSQCNHSIITIGTFGYWTAYLAGGETVYFTNYTQPGSPFLDVFKYEAFYLPSWIPMASNLSGVVTTTTTPTP